MKHTLTFFLLIHSLHIHSKEYDLTVIGKYNFNLSIPLQTVSTIYRHNNNLKINFVNISNEGDFCDIPQEVQRIIKEEDASIAGTVAYYTGCLAMPHNQHMFEKTPNSPIKIALTMVESTKIPEKWGSIINNYFDAIVIPDEWLKSVYIKCGVKKPIFTIPLSCFLEDFLNKPLKQKRNTPFRFGVACSMFNTKNTFKLATAFLREFHQNEKVELHVLSGFGKFTSKFKKLIHSDKNHHIIFHNNKLPYKDYVDFICSLDCYVLISKGEGFSITPREALAAGIPCILSNNTAHTTICNTGLVRAIPSNIIRPSKGELFGPENVGDNFDCQMIEVKKALRDVYNNYSHYLALAHKGREWVKQYTHKNLEKKYHSLFKPSKIILGKRNEVTDDYFMTNSKELYTKYKTVFKCDEVS